MKKLFSADLIRKAEFYFRGVYNDGDRIRIFFTNWQYETETIFRSNAALKKFLADYEQQLMDEFDFMAPKDLRELGVLY